MTNIALIVAIAEDKGIGRANDMLVYISEDLKRFKAITSGHTIIMGRKTLLSLPKYPLPNRRHIVITSDVEAQFDGCEVVHSVEEALVKVEGESEAFVIGGGSIYNQFYAHANKLYLTQIHRTFEGADVFFSSYSPEDWTIASAEKHHDGKNNLDYSFIDLVKAPSRSTEGDS
ncbi:MAG: dihydrofolate reductase [Mangrovibacterium sp.]